MISPEQIQEVQERTDLVQLFNRYTDVRRAGAHFKCCCPFHNERTPSLVIYPEDNHYHCYGCGAHGNPFTLVMEKENMSFPDAVEFLARPLGIELERSGDASNRISRGERDQMLEIMNRTTSLYERFCGNDLRAKPLGNTLKNEACMKKPVAAIASVGPQVGVNWLLRHKSRL